MSGIILPYLEFITSKIALETENVMRKKSQK